MLHFIVIYSFFAYLFMLGVMTQDANKELEKKAFWLAPIFLPFLLGQIVIAHQIVNNDIIGIIKKRKAQEKEAEEINKKVIEALQRDLTEALERELRRPMSAPRSGGLNGIAKEFNDMMQEKRNPFNY
jgi:hypothetical protein